MSRRREVLRGPPVAAVDARARLPAARAHHRAAGRGGAQDERGRIADDALHHHRKILRHHARQHEFPALDGECPGLLPWPATILFSPNLWQSHYGLAADTNPATGFGSTSSSIRASPSSWRPPMMPRALCLTNPPVGVAGIRSLSRPPSSCAKVVQERSDPSGLWGITSVHRLVPQLGWYGKV